MKKVDIIKKISMTLSNEYPGIKLSIKLNKKLEKNLIEFEIFYNISKKNNTENKFKILDGGIKDRIIRKTKNLIKMSGLESKNINNSFIIM